MEESSGNGGGSDRSADVAHTTTTTLPIRSQIARNLSPLESDDWAENLPTTDHIRFFKDTNWAASHLGPLASWSTALRLHTFTVFADSQASTIYWGPEKVAIYNEAFIPLAGKAHPALMGSPFYVAFKEIWEHIQPVFNMAESTGKASDVNEMEMYVERSGYVEETCFTGNFNPIRGNTGGIEGFYNSVHEITKAKIRDRRSTMLNMMELPPNTDTRRMAEHVIPAFETNPRDIPMAMLYHVDEETEPGISRLHLIGNIGIPDDHALLVDKWDLTSNEGIVPLLREARWKEITVKRDDRFTGVQWRGYGEPSELISVIPILAPGRLFGFAVLGTNPRRAVDEDQHQFTRDISAKLSSIATAIFSAWETRKREERLQKELADSVRRIRYMAENASIGMQYISTDGKTVWANEEYYRLTGHPRAEEDQYDFSFLDIFIPADRTKALDTWNRLIQGESGISVELHLNQLYLPPHGDPEPSCVLSHSFRVMEEAELKSIMTFTTDVSAFKWVEASEARKALEASEARRKQEEFIDLVSHELRNPLSAIFQLADTIINSYPTVLDTPNSNPQLAEALRNNIENANTILMCAKHQKRIVDDVLTLSRLEYTMLSVSPRPTQMSVLIRRCVKMFEQELISHNITIKSIADASIRDNDVDWVLCDESRVQQILINLLTNAIKFTKLESKRGIEVTFGAVTAEPRKAFPHHGDIRWAPNQSEMSDLTLNPEWGLGQPLFLTIIVRDTGIGMSAEEVKKLFQRFEQASERTSIRYGGSGLGLFVSQKLAEKQGGEIGVRSESGNGSTFAFYIKSRRIPKEAGTTVDLTRPLASLHSTSNRAATGLPPTTEPSRMHVLLVEDNLVNQRVLERQLKSAGCVVYLANHGLEALEMLRESDAWHEPPPKPKHLDIILMDWEMPIMDGLTASREIRKLEAHGKVVRHVEILGTTANARAEQIEIAVESGIDSVMVKPFLIKDLLEGMRERLGAQASTVRMTVPRSATDP